MDSKIPIVVSTSDNYHHILPTFFMLYGRTIGRPMELVGYKKPEMKLPDYVKWYSMGEQRGPKFFSDDLGKFFSAQPQHFCYMMEDSFLKSFDIAGFNAAFLLMQKYPHIGKFCLTNESMRREHTLIRNHLFKVSQNAKYRLSTQPAIWNRDYILQYLTPGLSPWDFETQPQQNDGWDIVGDPVSIIQHNEGVTRHDIHKLNLDGIQL